MPSRNRVKEYDVNSYYHIYNRGVNKKDIFKSDEDFSVFLNILKRHLSDSVAKDKFGREYTNYGNLIELLAFCLMPNHFHLFIYQSDDWRAIEHLLRQVSVSYAMYFNRKYKRVGPLFQDRYKAARIDNDAYLQHITRYIHLNPRGYKDYQWSSYQYYTGKKSADWIKPSKIIDLFKSKDEYVQFVDDFTDFKDTEELVGLYLAG